MRYVIFALIGGFIGWHVMGWWNRRRAMKERE